MTIQLRVADKRALRALHAGYVGVEYPTYKMIPARPGNERVLMSEGVFHKTRSKTVLLDFDETFSEHPESVIEELFHKGLAISVQMEDCQYKALLMTPLGLETATSLFGPPAVLVHVAEEDGKKTKITPIAVQNDQDLNAIPANRALSEAHQR